MGVDRWQNGRFKLANNVPPSGNRVVASGIQRMTAADPFNRHPPSFQSPIFFNGFIPIMGTGRGKTTGGRQRTGKR